MLFYEITEMINIKTNKRIVEEYEKSIIG